MSLVTLLTWNMILAFITAAAGSWAVVHFVRTQRPVKTHNAKVIPSPRETLLPFLSSEQAAKLPYPPHSLPGSRDVDSPYGVMRVYEWGPEHGRKVMLLHGDTTPTPILSSIAEGLVDRGCRVMIWDLWGRGYSDSPLGVPYDTRLLVSQILIAITSSPLSWTGSGSDGFSCIGYSLGGGIVMSFAAYFPHLVNSIVLLGPGGIIRSKPEIYDSVFFRFPYLFPRPYLRRLVGQYLGVYLKNLPYHRPGNKEVSPGSNASNGTVKPSVRTAEALDVPAIMKWQFENHKGFVRSLLNTSQNGPITHQHSDWAKVCAILRGDVVGTTYASSKLYKSKILVILGDADDVVIASEVSQDLCRLLGGSDHAEIKTVPGGHGFPVPYNQEVGEYIWQFWKLKAEP